MKRVVLAFVYVLVVSGIHAQNLHSSFGVLQVVDDNNGETVIDLGTSHVISDFGLRRSGDDSRWHRGVDINPMGGAGDLGHTIKSFSSGSIASIHGDIGYKLLAIDGPGNNNFGYGHIFRNSETDLGDFKLLNLPSLDTYVIIYLPDDDENSYALTSLTGVAFQNASFSYLSVNYSAVLGNLRNTVEFGDAIAPVGDAAAVGLPHIHLYNFVNPYLDRVTSAAGEIQHVDNCKDPLEYLYHDEPNYEIKINQLVQRYGTSQSTIEVRPVMKDEKAGATYKEGILNIDEVSVHIRKEHESEASNQLIKGPFLDSRISDGSRNSSQRYPASGDKDIVTNYGSITNTGYLPHAYRDPENNVELGYPRDDYFFADFVLRIDKDHNQGQAINANDLAKISQDARYEDGLHILTPSLITVTSSTELISHPFELKIDNFRPYIQRVIIKKRELGIPTDIIYAGVWTWDGSANTFSIVSYEAYTGDAQVIVTASEPLEFLNVKYDGLSLNVPDDLNAASTEWKYSIIIPSSASQTIAFEGRDINNNQLDKDPSTIAVRTGSGTNNWTAGTDPGTDQNHNFNQPCGPAGGIAPGMRGNALNDAGSCDVPYVSIEVSKRNPEVGEAITFSLIAGDYQSISWDFGTNAVADNTNEEEVTVVYLHQLGTGNEDVSVTIDGDLYAFPDFIQVGASTEPFSFDISRSPSSGSIQIDEEITFSLNQNSLNGLSVSDIISYSWDFGGGAEYGYSNAASVSVNYSFEGLKTIKLTICTSERCETVVRLDFLRVFKDLRPIEADFSCPSPSRNVSIFGSSIFGSGSGEEAYYWDMGDGSHYTGSFVSHEYKTSGYYNIKLTVCDESGCDTKNDCTIALNESHFPVQYKPNFTVNGLRAVDYWLCIMPDCPYFLQTFEVTKGMKFVLSDASEQFNGNIGPIEGGTFEISNFDRGNEPFNTCSTCIYLSGEGPHSVNSNLLGVEVGDLLYIRYRKTGAIYRRQQFYVSARVSITVGSSDLSTCWASVTDFSLDRSCWDNGDIPINISVSNSNCNYDFLSVEDLKTNEIISSGSAGLFWPESKLPDNFPYETDLKVNVHYDCGEGINCSVITSKVFKVRIEGSNVVEINSTEKVCKGASVQIGTEPKVGFDYKWSGATTAQLSSSSVANPIFTALSGNSETYSLLITNLETGCSSTETVTINVGSSDTSTPSPLAYTVNAGDGSIVLGNPLEGIGYDYKWSPGTNLSNDKVPNPVFSTPNTSGTYTYSINASFRECAVQSAGQVTVVVKNDPPTNLEVSASVAGVMNLKWDDRSVEKRFVIQRKEYGTSSWEVLAEVPSNITQFSDAYCLNASLRYDYRLRVYDLNNSALTTNNGYSNTVVGVRPMKEYYLKWTTNVQDIVQIGQRNITSASNEILVTGVTGDDSNVTSGGQDDQNLVVAHIDKNSGEITQRKSNGSCGSFNYYAGNCDGYARIHSVIQKSSNGLFLLNQHSNSDRTFHLFSYQQEFERFEYLTPSNQPVFGSLKLVSADGNFIVAGVSEIVGTSGYRPLIASKFSYDLKDYLGGANDFQTLSEAGFNHHLFDVISVGFYVYYITLSGNYAYNRDLVDAIHIYKTNAGLSQTTSRRGVDNLVLGNLQGIEGVNSGLILGGESFDLNAQGGIINRKVVIKSLNSNLNTSWTKTLLIDEYETRLLELSKFGNNEYAMFLRADELPNSILMVNLDSHGNEIGRYRIPYMNASTIFDLILEGDKLYVASGANSSSVNISQYSLIPDLSQKVNVCENVGDNESFSKVGAIIEISETCESVVYASGSTSNFVATTSITLHPGTWIQNGSYFSAMAVESISQGDCSEFGIPSSRVTFSESKEFTNELQSESVYLVYPNPSTDHFLLSIVLLAEADISVKFTDLMGRELWSLEASGSSIEESIDTSSMVDGVYLLRINTSSEAERIIKVLISSKF